MPQPASTETKLPRAVEEQTRRLREKYAPELASTDEPGAPSTPPAPPAGTPPPTPPVEPPAAPTPPEAPSPDSTAQRGAPTDDPRHADPAYWQQRFNVAQGLMRQQREDFDRRIATHAARIDELTRENATLRAAAPARPLPDDFDLTTVFTPAQIEQFGEDQCRVMAQASRAMASQTANEAESRAQEARRTAAEEDENARQREFLSALTTLYPTWQTDDQDPNWLVWLAEQDPSTGLVRQDVLNRHMQARSHEGVARLFQSWRASLAPAPTPPAPRRQPPVTPNGTAAGGHAGGMPRAAGPGEGYPSSEEIRDFYTRSSVKRPGQPGFVTDEERARFEARLQQARAA